MGRHLLTLEPWRRCCLALEGDSCPSILRLMGDGVMTLRPMCPGRLAERVNP